MARFPSLSSSACSLRESLITRLAGRLASCPVEVFPFHLGDTWRAPPPAARLSERRDLDDPALYRYGPPGGDAALVEALVDKCRRRNGLGWVDRSAVQVTAGATLALHAAVRVLLDPGDELLLLAPYWPIIHGIATAAGAVPVEVELSQRLYRDPATDVYAALAARATERTRAIYLINPNNPDGKLLSGAALEGVARFARDRDLWVIADEVYEDLVYAGTHRSVASLDGMAERTVTAFSLSKSYALAGMRLGYVVADPKVLHAIRKVVTHAVYSVPLALQRVALAALTGGAGWLDGALADYRAARDLASRRSPAPHHLPDAGAYLFLDLSPWVPDPSDADSIGRLHDRLLERGLALASGGQFGRGYERHARLCFTAMPPEKLAAGLDRLAEALQGARR
jgi:aspartate/methionine/tyrosine aminotransferase